MSDYRKKRPTFVRKADGQEHHGGGHGSLEADYVAGKLDATDLAYFKAVFGALPKGYGDVRRDGKPAGRDQPIKDGGSCE